MTNSYIARNEISEKSSDVVWHKASVSHKERIRNMGHNPVLLWFTGLSGSGKSTIANAVDRILHSKKLKTYVLDGDNIRHGLNNDLGFSDEERMENIRRIGEVAKLFVDAGLIVSTAFISPFIADRQMIRNSLDEGLFIEIFVDTSLEVCAERDPKGLYKNAREGLIKNFTGIDSDYEVPESPEIHLATQDKNIHECANIVVDFLYEHQYI